MLSCVDYQIVKTKHGNFLLGATSAGLRECHFPSRGSALPRSYAKSHKRLLAGAGKKLCDYLSGKRVFFENLEFDLEGFTPFQRKVYQALRKVPFGEVVSYGDLAKSVKSPGAARAVGSVMNKNRLPIFLPCHRVVGSKGNLCGFSAGLSWKRRLLALESVPQNRPLASSRRVL